MSITEQRDEWKARATRAEAQVDELFTVIRDLRARAKQDRLNPPAKWPVSDGVKLVCEVVAEEFGIPFGQLFSTSRAEPAAWPRQIAMALAHELTDAGYSELGRQFDKDHSTVTHARVTVANRCEVHPADRERVERIRAALHERMQPHTADAA